MSSLTFLNPAFLWALPAATLPVLFHLFFRVRTRRRPFPTFMFFIAGDPMLTARRRIREWLTLILRTLAIVFVVLALAGPVRPGMADVDGGIARVLILDNSGSMSAADAGGRRPWDAAIEAASKKLTDAAFERALVGTDEPVFDREGNRVGLHQPA